MDPATGNLAVRDLASGAVRLLTRSASRTEFAYFSVVSPDSRSIAYAWHNADGFYELRSIGVETGEPRVLYRNEEAGFVQPCAFTPDGKLVLTLFFRRDNISQIALVPAAGGPARALKSLAWVYPNRMDLSPDGRFIVYDDVAGQDSPQRDLFVLAIDGSRQTQLLSHPANDIFPLWAKDGKSVFFVSDRSGKLDLWRQPVESGKPAGAAVVVRRNLGRILPMGVTSAGAFYYAVRAGATDVWMADRGGNAPRRAGSPRTHGANSQPDWSPDSRSLVYLTRVGNENFGQESRALSIYSTGTGEERMLETRLAWIERPRWSPDGRVLLIGASDRHGFRGLWRVEADSGEARPLVREKSTTYRGLEGIWSGDGRAIFYVPGDAAEIRRLLESGEEQALYRGAPGTTLSCLALSRDGRWLAFVASSVAGVQTVLVMPAAGGEPHQAATARQGSLDMIEWQGDGLLVGGPGKSGASTFRVSSSGGPTQKLEWLENRSGPARFNRDATHVAFTVASGGTEIWELEP